MEAMWFGFGVIVGVIAGVAILVVVVIRWITASFEEGDKGPEPALGTIADRKKK